MGRRHEPARGLPRHANEVLVRELQGCAIWEVRDGKLAHNWVERSAYELYQTLKAKSE